MTSERYELALNRIKDVTRETEVPKKFQEYFNETAKFLLLLNQIYKKIETSQNHALECFVYEEYNKQLYGELFSEKYSKSYGNPEYAVKMLGSEFGQTLCFMYAQLRSAIPYVYEQNQKILLLYFELYLEVYTAFCQGVSSVQEIKSILYWNLSDYADVFVKERILEQIDPRKDFVPRVLKFYSKEDLTYLYMYGEYIGKTEIDCAKYIATLSEEVICKMADVFTEGFRQGFLATGKDIRKKSTVNIRYTIGFERVIIKAIENFKEMGLKPVIYRATTNVLTKRGQHEIGYHGSSPNRQYAYDHRNDQGLVLDKRFVERKLEVMETTLRDNKELAGAMAGPAVMETFGETPFIPDKKAEEIALLEEQEKVQLFYDSKAASITNNYIRGEERSYTIVAYPIPQIGEKFPEIFKEVIRINTLDLGLYQELQKKIIDVLDKGSYVRVLGNKKNHTDLKITLKTMKDSEKETIFENCTADVNIPVGEVFTSPVLKGTTGILHVTGVYLEGFYYKDLVLRIKDGMITDYSCKNFESEEANKKHVFETILFNHETLPMGEFAIGTNTTAYEMARRFGIEDKLPILIAEKTGPHFAFGDTCYSHSEDVRVFNLDGKEIIAKDNECSIKRLSNQEEAYFNCHTDITIPYDELGEITVVEESGRKTELIKNGLFVLPGTDILNEPLKNHGK